MVPGQSETLAGAWRTDGRLNARVAFILKPCLGSFRSLTSKHRHFLVLLPSFVILEQHVGVGDLAFPPTKGKHAEKSANWSPHSFLPWLKSELTKPAEVTINTVNKTFVLTCTVLATFSMIWSYFKVIHWARWRNLSFLQFWVDKIIDHHKLEHVR